MATESMYIELYKKIKNWIIEKKYKNGDILPTEKELAEEFFVSRVTVQKAMQLLSSDGYISRKAGRGTYVNYDESPSMRDSKNNLIGVILCNLGSSFGLDLFISIEKALQEQGYSMIFKNSRSDSALESRFINEIIAAGACGLIIQPLHGEFYNEKIIQLQLQNFPIVLVDRNFKGINIPAICTNNALATENAVFHLFENGHDNIGFVCYFPENTSSVEARINGFKSAFFKSNKLVSVSNLLTTIESPGTFSDPVTWQRDIDKIVAYLKKNPQITALIASEFTVTKLIFSALEIMGKRVPEDYSVVCFDDPGDGIMTRKITHIRQNQEQLGEVSVKLLQKKISNELTSDLIYIPHDLINGDSVKKIN